jgi:hypothetical protein
LRISRDEDSPSALLSLFSGSPTVHSTAQIEIGADNLPPVQIELKDAMISRRNGGPTLEFRISGDGRPFEAISPVMIEPASKVGPNFSDLWEQIQLTPHEEDVITCLQLISPDVEKVGLVGIPNPTPKVRLRNNPVPVPMSSLGGGVTRLFHLACGLVLSGNNVLLVDEIENGIHQSVQANLWRFVLAIAKRHKVQVFATTHSLDCLRGFALAIRDLPDVSARVIRLDSDQGKIVPVMFDEEEARIAVREDIEIR